MALMKRLLTALLSLLAGFAPMAQANPINLPDLGDASSAVISPSQERKLGEDFMRKARRSLAFVDDPEVTTYIQNLGQRLVARSDNPGTSFRFFVVSDPTINAFAIPGGFIGVHTGLILATENEAELASVLAHEIAHITQKHIPRMLAEEQHTMPAMAALLAAALLAGRGGEAAIALAAGTVAQKSINFTRASEEEADRIGIRLLADTGFDPRAMPAFFERMQKMNRVNETNLPEFLATHPVTTARIADSRGRAEQYSYRQAPDTPDFQLVRAKLRAAAPGDPADIVRTFAANVAEGKAANLDAERYAYGLALMRAQRYDAARTEVQKLVDRSPVNLFYRILQAELELAAGRSDLGLQYYAGAYKRSAAYYPLAISYARALVRTKRARDAEPIIRATLEQRPDDPALYELLSQADDATGKIAESHQALAEHYYLRGNPNAAIEQLQLASRRAGDNFYLQSSVEARIQAIKEEVALLSGKK
jgi:predicted Zn-dependent protease